MQPDTAHRSSSQRGGALISALCLLRYRYAFYALPSTAVRYTRNETLRRPVNAGAVPGVASPAGAGTSTCTASDGGAAAAAADPSPDSLCTCVRSTAGVAICPTADRAASSFTRWTAARSNSPSLFFTTPDDGRRIGPALSIRVDTVPGTAKIRAGYDHADDVEILARAAEAGGADLLTIHCRTRAFSTADVDGPEQVVLDENEVAAPHKFCSTGAVEVSPSHGLLAYATDTSGYETYIQRESNPR